MKGLSMKELIRRPSTFRRKFNCCRIHCITERLIIVLIVIGVCLMFLQCGILWRATNPSTPKPVELGFMDKKLGTYSAVQTFQGRATYIEDRYALYENINGSGLDFFAVFDGHSGKFSVEYIMEKFIVDFLLKVSDIQILLNESFSHKSSNQLDCLHESHKPESFNLTTKTKEFRDFYMYATKCFIQRTCSRNDPEFLNRTMKLIDDSKKPERFGVFEPKWIPKQYDPKCYINNNKNGQIDFGQLLKDELIYFDWLVVREQMKRINHSGSTAVIAIIWENQITFANVGDSRAVICDHNGQPIQMTIDHKAQMVGEAQRIFENGGFVTNDFEIWRAMGILMTTRSIGDYYIKRNNIGIPDPDITTYDLSLNPQFMIIASDGFWDVLTDYDAVEHVKKYLHLKDFGASKAVARAFELGTIDNITVLIVVFGKNRTEVRVAQADKHSIN